MIQEKKCKGSGKALNYGCGDIVPVIMYGKSNRIYGIGLSCGCYSKWIRNSEEGKAMIEKATLKATAPRKELEKAIKTKKENTTLANLKINVRYDCHNYIKERDKGKPCVSCGGAWSKYHQAGHWKKAELYSTLKFNELNIHNQCKKCNLFEDGNVQKYSDRIHLRITREEKEELEHLAELEKKGVHKWDREELKAIRKYYQTKLKQLKHGS